MEINVSKGQGITQAIASNLGMSKDDCKKVKLDTWKSVMTLVNEANTQNLANNKNSIFTGGNDVNTIGDKSTWQSNFKVNNGDVMKIDDSIYNKIKQLLGVSTEEVAEEVTEEPATATGAAAEVTEVEEVEVADVDAEEVQETEETTVVNEVKTEAGKKGETIDNQLKEMSDFDENGNVKNISLDIVGDEWRALAGKKDKTEAEKQQLDTQYTSAIKDIGASYTAFIDEKYGDGDGIIDNEEYAAYEDAGVPDELRSDEESMALVQEMTQIGFNRLDLNKDGVIDHEEVSSYLHAMDFGTEEGKSTGLNGKISAYDFLTNSLALSNEETSMLDEKLKYTYKKLFGKEVK